MHAKLLRTREPGVPGCVRPFGRSLQLAQIDRLTMSSSRTFRSPPRTGRARAVKDAMRALGSWNELVVMDESAKEPGVITKISTARFALVVFAIAGLLILYIGHVYTTQDILNDLQVLRRDNLRLHLQHNRLRGQYDAATGPSVIYRRAPDLGLEDGFIYGETIRTAAQTPSNSTDT